MTRRCALLREQFAQNSGSDRLVVQMETRTAQLLGGQPHSVSGRPTPFLQLPAALSPPDVVQHSHGSVPVQFQTHQHLHPQREPVRVAIHRHWDGAAGPPCGEERPPPFPSACPGQAGRAGRPPRSRPGRQGIIRSGSAYGTKDRVVSHRAVVVERLVPLMTPGTGHSVAHRTSSYVFGTKTPGTILESGRVVKDRAALRLLFGDVRPTADSVESERAVRQRPGPVAGRLAWLQDANARRGPHRRVWQFFLAREAQLRKNWACYNLCPPSGALLNPCWSDHHGAGAEAVSGSVC
jgi:hypothetical protein